MKKYLLLLLAVVSVAGAMAQTEVLKIKMGDKVITYPVADIDEITFDVESSRTLFKEFQGYITADGTYFKDSYFGGVAKLSVWNTASGNDVTISDPVWGEAEFVGVTMAMGQLSGEGTITVSAQYGGGTYAATISGAMTSPFITIPGLMQGGTTLTYHLGDAPKSLLVKGSHQGSVTVEVGGQSYTNSSITYVVTANEDGTIDIVVPEFSLGGTVMGDLTLGTYTIKNIAYDEEKEAFYRDYTQDELSFHFKAVKDGTTTMDKDYTFTQLGNIVVKPVGSGLTVVNSFQPGAMPFPIVSTFTKSTGHTR